MDGDDAVRFCDKCRKNVYNVAALAPEEAVALVERAEGRVCLQLTRRTDGTIVTGDCWTQLRRARKRGLLALAAAAPMILAAQFWSQGFGLRAFYGIFHRPPGPTVTRGELAPLVVPAPTRNGAQSSKPSAPTRHKERPATHHVSMGAIGSVRPGTMDDLF
jgi:hypothetical protein